MNGLSQDKVVPNSLEKCYTIAEKGYIIHTFRKMEGENQEMGMGNVLFGAQSLLTICSFSFANFKISV